MKCKIKISILICATLLLAIPKKSMGQDEKFYSVLSETVRKLDGVGIVRLYNKQHLDRAFLFSIAISTSKSGKIEKITFSNQTAVLDSIINFKNLTERIRAKEHFFLPYKNEILVTTVMFQARADWRMDNVPEFRNFFATLYDHLKKVDQTKKIHVLPTIGWYPNPIVE